MKKSFLSALALAAAVAFSAPVAASAATTTTTKPAVHQTMKKKPTHKKVAHKKATHKKVAHKKATHKKVASKKMKPEGRKKMAPKTNGKGRCQEVVSRPSLSHAGNRPAPAPGRFPFGATVRGRSRIEFAPNRRYPVGHPANRGRRPGRPDAPPRHRGSKMPLDSQTLRALEAVSTATLTTVLLKKGLRNVWMRGTMPLAQGQKRVVGPAFTLRFVPAREDLATPGLVGLAGLDPGGDRGDARRLRGRRRRDRHGRGRHLRRHTVPAHEGAQRRGARHRRRGARPRRRARHRPFRYGAGAAPRRRRWRA